MSVLFALLVLFSGAYPFDEIEPWELNPVEYIRARGFDARCYKSVTDDGYVLKTYRIINEYSSTRKNMNPVVLMHGLGTSCYDWMINDGLGRARPPNDPFARLPREHEIGRELAFELANQGFDVWLPNSRGNALSSGHRSLKRRGTAYWNFTLDHMARHDVPAIVALVIRETGRQSVSWVGHSYGAGIVMAHLAHFNPDLPVRPLISVAGATRMSSHRPLMHKSNVPQSIFRNRLHSWFIPFVQSCAYLPMLCASIVNFNGGLNVDAINKTRMGVYAAHIPSGTSSMVYNHVSHLRHGFHQHGSSQNKHIYDLKGIINKYVILMYSIADTVVTEIDSKWLVQQFSGVALAGTIYEHMEHMDFLLGVNNRIFNKDVVEYLVQCLSL